MIYVPSNSSDWRILMISWFLGNQNVPKFIFWRFPTVCCPWKGLWQWREFHLFHCLHLVSYSLKLLIIINLILIVPCMGLIAFFLEFG